MQYMYAQQIVSRITTDFPALIPSDFNGLSCNHSCSNISFISVPTTTYSAATSTVAVDFATTVPSKCGCREKSAKRFRECKSTCIVGMCGSYTNKQWQSIINSNTHVQDYYIFLSYVAGTDIPVTKPSGLVTISCRTVDNCRTIIRNHINYAQQLYYPLLINFIQCHTII